MYVMKSLTCVPNFSFLSYIVFEICPVLCDQRPLFSKIFISFVRCHSVFWLHNSDRPYSWCNQIFVCYCYCWAYLVFKPRDQNKTVKLNQNNMQVTYFLKKIASTWPERSSGLCQKRAFGNFGCPKSLNLKLSLRIFVTIPEVWNPFCT